MATLKKRRSAPAKKGGAQKAGSEKSMTVQVSVEATPDTPTYYVNHAGLTFGEHEVAIVLARMPTKPSREELEEARQLGELWVEPELQVIVPPTLLPRLIDALKMVQEEYEENFGKIRRIEDGPSK